MPTEGEGSQQRVWKRLNFFKGLITSESDWIEEQAYRLEKHRLHNRLCHGPGVVRGFSGELVVTARGDLSIEIQPGCAIDGEGNELVLPQTAIKHVTIPGPTPKTDGRPPPEQLYIVLRYVEVPSDFIAYKHNLAIKGHRRMLESAEIEITQAAPNLEREVELARLLVERDAKRLHDAKDANDPKPNELDLRFVPRAGSTGAFGIDPAMQAKLSGLLKNLRAALLVMAVRAKVKTAHDAVSAILQMATLMAAGQVDGKNVFGLLALVEEMVEQVAIDVYVNHAEYGKRDEFKELWKQVKALKLVLADRRRPADSLEVLSASLERAAALIMALFAPK
jgi:hypothetical protein